VAQRIPRCRASSDCACRRRDGNQPRLVGPVTHTIHPRGVAHFAHLDAAQHWPEATGSADVSASSKGTPATVRLGARAHWWCCRCSTERGIFAQSPHGAAPDPGSGETLRRPSVVVELVEDHVVVTPAGELDLAVQIALIEAYREAIGLQGRTPHRRGSQSGHLHGFHGLGHARRSGEQVEAHGGTL
jgi:hypothetical protein